MDLAPEAVEAARSGEAATPSGAKLLDGLAELVALLRPLSTTAELDAAAAIIGAHRNLGWALTPRELARLARSATPATQALAETLGARARERCGSPRTCSNCGRPTVYTSGPNVRHGNPCTPASDTEVECEDWCASCGWKESSIV